MTKPKHVRLTAGLVKIICQEYIKRYISNSYILGRLKNWQMHCNLQISLLICPDCGFLWWFLARSKKGRPLTRKSLYCWMQGRCGGWFKKGWVCIKVKILFSREYWLYVSSFFVDVSFCNVLLYIPDVLKQNIAEMS